MANSIELAKKYVDLLDEVYAKVSVTADLVASPDLVRAGANANEIVYPQIATTGLGDYDRNSGYTDGSVNVVWKTAAFDYDRGTKLSIDTMDDEETFNIAFGKALSELIRTKVAPEADAYFFSKLAGTDGVSTGDDATFADASAFLEALIAAKSQMDEDEVTEEGRILYATPTLLNGVMALDTTKSREVLATFAKKVAVPQSRFYSAISLLDGKSEGEEAGGYKAADGASKLNFVIVEPSAIMKFDKHVVSSIIAPEMNPDSDAYIVKYRKYGLNDVYANKAAGIYISKQAAS